MNLNMLLLLLQRMAPFLEHLDGFKQMTVWQWSQLVGYALVGAGAGYMGDSSWIGAAGGALTGAAAHLWPLMQTSPADRARDERIFTEAKVRLTQP